MTIGRSGYGGGGSAASGSGSGAVAGWQSLFNVNFTTAPATTWTSGDQGTSPTIDGVQYIITSLSTGNASIGDANGLRSSDSTSTIGVRSPGWDLSDGTPEHRALAIVVALQDDGVQTGVTFGDGWNDSWTMLRLTTSTVNPQRRHNSNQYNGTHPFNELTANAIMLVGTMGGTDLYKFLGAVDYDDLPHPDDSGWVFVGNAGTGTLLDWPILSTNAKLQFWQNGATTLELYAFEVFGMPATP